jgi:Uma2 family endonuclease
VERIMTTTQADISAIQQAIRQLTREQREELAEWILNTADFGPRVAETPLAWGDSGIRAVFSVEEYLEMKRGAVRYEYVGGEIFAMNSPTVRHDVIVTNLLGNFHAQLRGGPCKMFSPNTAVRLRVDQSDIIYLPDLAVACGPFSEDALDLQYLANPVVVMEVSSPATEATDRREKALNYRRAPSLEEYVLIAQRPLNVTTYRRSNDWKPSILTEPDAVLELRAVEVHMTLADIYEGTR